MRRKLNVKLVAIVFGGLLVVGAAVHFVHGYQLARNAHRLLERADDARGENDLDRALTLYDQYLKFVPNDVETVQKYARALDQRARSGDERVQVVLKMEQVLRVKPGEHDLRFRLVHNLIALDRYPEALSQLRKLQGVWHDKAQVLHMIGWCQDAQKEYAQAVRSFEEAKRTNPKQLASYHLLAEVLQDRLNQPDEAAKAMDEMIQKNPASWEAYLSRARFHRRRGEEKPARVDLERALELSPKQPEVILEVADAARFRGDWRHAVDLLTTGSKLYPGDERFYIELARVKMQAGKPGEAIVHLKQGRQHAPKSAELAVLTIDLMIEQGALTEAAKKTAELIQTGGQSGLTSYLQARLSLAEKKWSEAIRLLHRAGQDLGPRSRWSARVNVYLGLAYRQLGDREQELEAFQRAAAAEPGWAPAGIGLGEALLSAGRVEDASQTLEPLQVARDLPNGYWSVLARCRLNQQMRLPAAKRAWEPVEAALQRTDATSVAAILVRADYLSARGDFKAAEALLGKAASTDANEILFPCALADLAARQNQLAAAEALLEKTAMQKQFADRLEWRLALARLWSQRNGASDRAKLTGLARRLPANASAETRARLWRELADLWTALGEPGRAEELTAAVASALPLNLPSRVALFERALQKDQVGIARARLGEIRAIEGEQGGLWRWAEAALLVHQARGRISQLAQARKQLQTLPAKSKNWPRVALLSGAIHELEGKYQKAIEDYTRALELGETQPRVLASVLVLLVNRREYARAEAEIARYEQRLPLTRDLARLGAEIALKLREKHLAKVALARAERAVEVPTRDYRDALWLARIYQGAGEAAKAEPLLRAALDQAGHAPDTWIAWMHFLFQANRRDEALKDLERLKKEIAPGRQALTLARCYQTLHLPGRADDAYQAALKSTPDDFGALAYAADFYRQADRIDTAIKLYARLLDAKLAAPAQLTLRARRDLAILLGRRGEPTRALAVLDANRTLGGETIADRRIRLYLQSLAPAARQDAIDQFQLTLRAQPASADERVLLASMLESARQFGPARMLLAEVVAEHPATPVYLTRYASILIRMEETEEAERVLARLEALEPGSERARTLRAELKLVGLKGVRAP
ncbi:MAG: tetratricopeptide repeat protein [Planctomycetes bacterium]|nr:tetratricopeptide repeat protein [Planctomycetota bacterium]